MQSDPPIAESLRLFERHELYAQYRNPHEYDENIGGAQAEKFAMSMATGPPTLGEYSTSSKVYSPRNMSSFNALLPSTLHHHYNMPQRRVLAEIPANARPRREVSIRTRERIYGWSLAGAGPTKIATQEQLPKSTIKKIISNAKTRQHTRNMPRSGRPRIATPRDRRRIISFARQHPKWTYDQLQRETGLDFSRSTFKRILQEHDIMNWRCKKRPALNQQQANLRLNFARNNLNTDWSRVLFSDECSVEKGSGKQRQWAFGKPAEKWQHDKIETYPKSKQGRIMVWAAIGSSIERSKLIIMDQDMNAQRHGYTATSYINTLEEGLLPIYNGQIFQQDNAPIHTAHVTTRWFNDHGIPTLQSWPPYSPDLNPIEHLWPHLKQALHQLRPDLDDISNQAQQRRIMTESLPEAWKAIDSDVFRRVLESMPRRIQAVIDAQGWQTKY